MRLLSLTLFILAGLMIGGCGGERPGAGTVPDPVSNEQALELISACQVSLVEASHSGQVRLSLREELDEDGWEREIFVAAPDVDELFAAAAEVRQGSCDIETATE
jgi:hypothetical protein